MHLCYALSRGVSFTTLATATEPSPATTCPLEGHAIFPLTGRERATSAVSASRHGNLSTSWRAVRMAASESTTPREVGKNCVSLYVITGVYRKRGHVDGEMWSVRLCTSQAHVTIYCWSGSLHLVHLLYVITAFSSYMPLIAKKWRCDHNSLCSLAQPIHHWSDTTAGSAITTLHWARHCPGLFIVLDSASNLHVWWVSFMGRMMGRMKNAHNVRIKVCICLDYTVNFGLSTEYCDYIFTGISLRMMHGQFSARNSNQSKFHVGVRLHVQWYILWLSPGLHVDMPKKMCE